ncbi:uncharacterized protein LOC121874014 isoform X2 [Homarus americanus]|uniref:uncharacterized protein LOC121874014 isoform X2 n=1 Tax=Homarus americanus TaxID=6706 RepID=UPI001C4438A9|nr:uncharacterized protein LOC121874014 isoform X2 [Homarus americanus]
MVVTSLVLLVAAGLCGGVLLLPTLDGKQRFESSVFEMMEAVLTRVTYSDYSVFLLTDGSTSPSTVYKLADCLRIPGGVGTFEVTTNDEDASSMEIQLSHLINLRELSSHTTIVVISDDPAFLTAFAGWSLKSGLIVWSTRLLAVTRLPLRELHDLQRAFSKMNAVLAIINDNSANIKCSMYIHLPYSPPGSQVLKVASWTPHRGLALTTHLPLFPEKFSKLVLGVIHMSISLISTYT